MHDLDIEVRVSRWPASATALILEPVTIEHPDAYKMPVFSIPTPAGTGLFQLRQKGRAALSVPNHFNARPFEFKYVARFEKLIEIRNNLRVVTGMVQPELADALILAFPLANLAAQAVQDKYFRQRLARMNFKSGFARFFVRTL